MSNVQEIYSEQWNNISDYFYNNGSYSWMCSKIKKYKTVIEICSGTGQSTLSLLEAGLKVISIEKNNFCIKNAKSLLESKGYKVGSAKSNLENYDIILLNDDILNNKISNYLKGFSFDLVICWNIGSY